MLQTGHKTFHNGKHFISFKRGFEEIKKDIVITVDKLYESDNLRLTLSDDENATFLFRIILTRFDYEDLKKQQGLLIDFENFPSQVVRLLQQCSSNNMFLILNEITPIQYNFEIVEHNEFRRLIHLSLKTGPANDEEVKQHMADNISKLKQLIAVLKNSLSSNEMVWNDKCSQMEAKIHDLILTVSKMEEEKIRNQKEFDEALKLEKDRIKEDRLQWQKNAEYNTNNLIENARENVNKKDKQICELNMQLKLSGDNIMQLEHQLSDKTQRSNLLEREVQTTHIEVATLKAKNATLERENIDKEKQIHELNLKCTYLDKTLKDNSNLIKELNDSLATIKMEKSNLERRLAISESMANKNNEAAHSTTEQLLKANQIISKQNNDLIEIKDKLLCRTAIALEQEKVIEQNMKEIEILKSDLETTKTSMNDLKKELSSLKEKYETNEQAIKDRDETIKNNNMVIQWLHKKVEENTGHIDHQKKTGMSTAVSSSPYLLTKNGQYNVSEASDESVNFYESSKMSHVEESPVQECTKKGLDPKYLKPAIEERQIKKKETTKSTINALQDRIGKENKNIDLPKVDYREKKISRATTYRATPVSAYFP